jgi:Family of unknown function (DUF6011)
MRKSISQIRSFARLHDLSIVDRDPKRTPKWRFRVAPDLAIELQPMKKTYRRGRWVHTRTERFSFQGRALCCEHVDIGSMSTPTLYLSRAGRPYVEVGFAIEGDDPWTYRTAGRGWSRDCPYDRNEVEQRVVTSLTDGTFDVLRPAQMLSLSCLMCGKALTDPVSQARLIGPECAKTSSPELPFFVDVVPDSVAAEPVKLAALANDDDWMIPGE